MPVTLKCFKNRFNNLANEFHQTFRWNELKKMTNILLPTKRSYETGYFPSRRDVWLVDNRFTKKSHLLGKWLD
jgi:hypothetical protein